MSQKNSYRKPYVGVSGLMTGDEVRQVASAIPDLRSLARPLMIGILMSGKTVQGISNKYPKRYPTLANVFDITDPVVDDQLKDPLADSRRRELLPLIHYASDDLSTYAVQIMGIMKCLEWRFDETVHSPIRGFQLNARWPDLRLFKELGFEESFAKYRIVLQISARAMTDLTDALTTGSLQLSPTDLVVKLKDYVGAVSDVLIDPSAGLGLPMDVARAMDLIDAIKSADLPFGVGVAGGLDAESLDRLAPLIEKYEDVSIDSEGRLRHPKTDELDVVKAKAYVAKAYAMLEGKKV